MATLVADQAIRDLIDLVTQAVDRKGDYLGALDTALSILNDIPIADDTLYEKCAECHLFVHEQDTDSEPDIAPYLHLYGECNFCVATDESHEAQGSGEAHTLDYWREHGPALMRARFDN